MKELFIREREDRRLRATVAAAVLAALLFLLVFTGCTPAKEPDVTATAAASPAPQSGVLLPGNDRP